MIVPIHREQLSECLDVLKESYEKTAVRFGMTEENCPYRGGTRLPYAALEEEYKNGFMMYGYVYGGEIVGFLSMSVEEPKAYIQDIAIRPAYQNRGFGSQLLRFALEKAKTLHCEKIALGMVHDNVPLRSWYEKQGFETVSLKKFEKVSYTVGTMEYRLCGCDRND